AGCGAERGEGGTPRRRVQRVVQGQPAAVRVAAQPYGVQAEPGEYSVQPGDEVVAGADRPAGRSAAAGVVDLVDRVEAMGPGQVGRVVEPDRRGGAAAVQQDQRLPVARATDVDVGRAVRRVHLDRLNRYRPL